MSFHIGTTFQYKRISDSKYVYGGCNTWYFYKNETFVRAFYNRKWNDPETWKEFERVADMPIEKIQALEMELL